jgi:Putative Ig domain
VPLPRFSFLIMKTSDRYSHSPISQRGFSMTALGFLAAVSLSSSACDLGVSSNGEKQGQSGRDGNRPPVVKLVEIVQESIRLDKPVTVRVETEDPERDPVTVRFRWLVNESAVPNQSDATFHPDQLKRGDKVSVEAIPNDGIHDGLPSRSRSVLVGNTPPTVKALTLEPREVKPGDRVRAVVDLWDADQDEIHHIVKWWRNDKVVAEGEGQNQFVVEQWNRGDVLTVSIVASDKESKGVETFSEPLTLSNSPPQFTTTPSVQVSKEGHFEYHARAVDGEGDSVTYRLEVAPPGMTINGQTGHVQWSVPIDMLGDYHVRLLALDDRGGSSFQEFTLSFPAQKAS